MASLNSMIVEEWARLGLNGCNSWCIGQELALSLKGVGPLGLYSFGRTMPIDCNCQDQSSIFELPCDWTYSFSGSGCLVLRLSALSVAPP